MNRDESRPLRQLRIVKGKEQRARIQPEQVDNKQEFFYGVYTQAKQQLEEIVQSGKINNCFQEMLSPEKLFSALHQVPNNVIAFCADRGQGKTTAMLSFSEYLKSQNPIDHGISPPFTDIRFHVLEPIDPTLMENNDSVLKIIISQMGLRFFKKAESAQRDSYLENYAAKRRSDSRTITQQFQQCAQAIDFLNKSPTQESTFVEDQLEQIATLGESTKLLVSLNYLIHDYLDFMYGSAQEQEKNYLVIQIDDADTDIHRCYQILEDMRKYLFLPQVIVLMATNMVQLESIVEQHFLEEYQNSVRCSGSMVTVERCHEIAMLYLEKVIPHTRRIYLPSLQEAICDRFSRLQLQYVDEKGENLLVMQGDCHEQLLDLLHRKTGMLFEAPADYPHNLLPTHLRTLTQFLSYFSQLEDLPDCYQIAVETFRLQKFSSEKDKDTIELWQKNLKKLETYLVRLWSTASLRENGRRFFLEVVSSSENIRNLYFLQNIEHYYVSERAVADESSSRSDLESYRKEFETTCSQFGVCLQSYAEGGDMDSISDSYADVMGALLALINLPCANREYKFVYAVRLFYSIQLHLMLVREIQYLGDSHDDLEKLPFDTLTDTFRDALFKAGNSEDTEHIPFAFWRCALQEAALWPQEETTLNSDALSNRESIADGAKQETNRAPFLRREVTVGKMTRTALVSIASDGNQTWRAKNSVAPSNAEQLIFSPLYPLLYALDVFACFGRVDILHTDTNEIDPTFSQIYISLIICLNWDVQYKLFKAVREQNCNSRSFVNLFTDLYEYIIPSVLKECGIKNEIEFGNPQGGSSRLKLDCFGSLTNGTNRQILYQVEKYLRPIPSIKYYIAQTEGMYKQISAAEKNCSIDTTTLNGKMGRQSLSKLYEKNKDSNPLSIESAKIKEFINVLQANMQFDIPAIAMVNEYINKHDDTSNRNCQSIIANLDKQGGIKLCKCELKSSEIVEGVEQFRDTLKKILAEKRGEITPEVAQEKADSAQTAQLTACGNQPTTSADRAAEMERTRQCLLDLGELLINALKTTSLSNPKSVQTDPEPPIDEKSPKP